MIEELAMVGPKVNLKIVADWGNANFHAVAGWLLAHLRWRSAEGSSFWVRTGTGHRDNIDALANHEVDVAITTPFHVSPEWAYDGINFYADERPRRFLRSLGSLPHNDRMVFAVREDTGLKSFQDIRDRKYPLKLASALHGHDNLMMWTVDRVLEEHGIEVEAWGGEWIEHDHPRILVPMVTAGRADAIIHEGIMVPQWRELVEKVPMRFIPFEPQALEALSSKYGLRPAVLSKGVLKAHEDIPCLDWSDWTLLVRDDMDDDIAYRLTQIFVEERAEIEARYRRDPPEHSPLTYPMEPRAMCRNVGTPLHPGAERYYREHGYLD